MKIEEINSSYLYFFELGKVESKCKSRKPFNVSLKSDNDNELFLQNG